MSIVNTGAGDLTPLKTPLPKVGRSESWVGENGLLLGAPGICGRLGWPHPAPHRNLAQAHICAPQARSDPPRLAPLALHPAPAAQAHPPPPMWAGEKSNVGPTKLPHSRHLPTPPLPTPAAQAHHARAHDGEREEQRGAAPHPGVLHPLLRRALAAQRGGARVLHCAVPDGVQVGRRTLAVPTCVRYCCCESARRGANGPCLFNVVAPESSIAQYQMVFRWGGAGYYCSPTWCSGGVLCCCGARWCSGGGWQSAAPMDVWGVAVVWYCCCGSAA